VVYVASFSGLSIFDYPFGDGSKSVNNRKTENRNDPDLVQAFLKKWWIKSDFKATNLPLSLRFKGSGCHFDDQFASLWYWVS
jgi:hypothetical protein